MKSKSKNKKTKNVLPPKVIYILLLAISLFGVLLLNWQRFAISRGAAFPDLPPLPENLANASQAKFINLPTPVPIFMYHQVNGAGLDKQFAWLTQHGFQTVGFDYLFNPQKISGKPIILTFDDGFVDGYTQAFPVLKKYSFTATFYLVTNSIGSKGSMTAAQILEMQAAGMSFGSHSLTHQNLPTVSEKRREQEIYNSKLILENILDKKVQDFCYPSGIYDQNVLDIVKNSNYQTATTVESGINSGPTDPFRLKRLNVQSEIDLENLPDLKNL